MIAQLVKHYADIEWAIVPVADDDTADSIVGIVDGLLLGMLNDGDNYDYT